MNNSWKSYKKRDIFNFSKIYKQFIKLNKTEWETVNFVKKKLEEIGFKDIKNFAKFKPGDKVYFTFKDKIGFFAIIGKNPTLKIIAAHADSPRLELKVNPFLIKKEINLSLLKVGFYGGFFPYVWLNIPLEIRGLLIKNKQKHFFKLKHFIIPDHLPHLSKDRATKPLKKAIIGEQMRILFSNAIDLNKKNAIDKFLKLFSKNIKISNFELKDFARSYIAIVPAIDPIDIGIDRSMIAGYGHDDRSSCFAGYRALYAIAKEKNTPNNTLVLVLIDKEEIGSEGITSIKSRAFKYFIKKIILNHIYYDGSPIEELLFNSYAISGDVTAGIAPEFENVYDLNNAAKLGGGVAIEKIGSYAGRYYENDPPIDMIDRLIEIYDKNKIPYQFASIVSKTEDIGGGGTISIFLAREGLNVIDIGCPTLAMHTPMEILSKADLYSLYQAYKVFYKEF